MLLEFKRDTLQRELAELSKEKERTKHELGDLAKLQMKERHALKTAALAQEQVRHDYVETLINRSYITRRLLNVKPQLTSRQIFFFKKKCI